MVGRGARATTLSGITGVTLDDANFIIGTTGRHCLDPLPPALTVTNVEILHFRGRGRTLWRCSSGTRRTTPEFFGSSSPAVIADGGGGNDTISGSNNADTLRGGEGADSLHGMFGDDIIQGGSGRRYAQRRFQLLRPCTAKAAMTAFQAAPAMTC